MGDSPGIAGVLGGFLFFPLSSPTHFPPPFFYKKHSESMLFVVVFFTLYAYTSVCLSTLKYIHWD